MHNSSNITETCTALEWFIDIMTVHHDPLFKQKYATEIQQAFHIEQVQQKAHESVNTKL